MAQHDVSGRPELDRQFFIRFGIVVVVLHAIIGGVALLSAMLGDIPRNPALQRREIAGRIAPVAKVATSRAELRQLIAESGAATRSGEPSTALAGAASGTEVYRQVCAGCHASGVLGAPRAQDRAAWQQRLAAAGGIDGLVQAAIEGVGQMPPRGGAPQLTDQQIRAAVEAMIE
ncbi:MAG: c-type cytochrome [Pseudomonadota bacterium]